MAIPEYTIGSPSIQFNFLEVSDPYNLQLDTGRLLWEVRRVALGQHDLAVQQTLGSMEMVLERMGYPFVRLASTLTENGRVLTVTPRFSIDQSWHEGSKFNVPNQSIVVGKDQIHVQAGELQAGEYRLQEILDTQLESLQPEELEHVSKLLLGVLTDPRNIFTSIQQF